MRRIKRFSSKQSEFLFRTVAILLPLISIVLLLSQTAFAQNTYVITDGERILIHTTSTTDPAIVLDEAGLSLGDDDTYTTQGGDGVSEITVRRNSTVTINNCHQIAAASCRKGLPRRNGTVCRVQSTFPTDKLAARVWPACRVAAFDIGHILIELS